MRLFWHGYPDSYGTFIDLTLTDRYLLNDELDHLIERANEKGGGRPKDER